MTQTATAQHSECYQVIWMGDKQLQYIITGSGTYLYYQDTSKSPKQWAKEVTNKLLKANISQSEVSKYLNSNYYFNKHYYKPTDSMVQMALELNS